MLLFVKKTHFFSSSVGFSLGEAKHQKVQLAYMALNHLQEHRDIQITQDKRQVSHFYLNSLLDVAFKAIFLIRTLS